MIKLEKTEVYGWEAAIRGMRNPLNSWDKSDSYPAVDCGKCGKIEREGICNAEDRDCTGFECYAIGKNDLKLMKKLSKAGDDHAKFLRMINVTVDITAPLYWWKEFDTYKVGTVANSCSTMHKITDRDFELDDFSHEHLTEGLLDAVLKPTIAVLNTSREAYIKFDEFNEKDPDGWDKGITCKKDIWWHLIQLLPSSYNQKRTVQLNYQVLKSMYSARKNHKLDEWVEFCRWIEELPYFKEICVNGKQ